MNENSVLYKAIEQAVILPYSEEMRAISDDSCEFSETYEKKIRRLVKDRRKPYYPLIKTTVRKIIFITAAVLMMGTITVAAVPQLREWFVGLFVSQNEKNADILSAKGDVPTYDLNNVFVYCEPTFVPQGFSEESRIEEEQSLVIYYTNDDKLIDYSQESLTSNHQIDTENRKTEYVTIRGREAFLAYDNNSSVIVWNDGTYSYSISGDLCKSDIIKMADSVNSTK